MITVFNRKELYMTYDMNILASVRNLLASHNIDYDYKLVDRKSSSPIVAGTRARTGTAFEKCDVEIQYYIYVHKSDYEKARAVLRENNL